MQTVCKFIKNFLFYLQDPLNSEIKKIKHHLYGIISVKKHFSAGDWLKEAKKKINICLKKKKLPIIVGGTGLYFNTITKGISKIPDIDIKTRSKVRTLFNQLGYQKFYEELLKLDPKVKNKILPTDSQRTQRAYEVKLKTKKSLFEWIAKTKSEFLDFNLKKVFIDIQERSCYKKFQKEQSKCLKKIVSLRLKNFNRLRINKSLSANKLIGVQEINQYLKGMISLDECRELINIKTRQYAKRQNTWARGHMKNWNKLYSKNFSILLKKTLKVIS